MAYEDIPLINFLSIVTDGYSPRCIDNIVVAIEPLEYHNRPVCD